MNFNPLGFIVAILQPILLTLTSVLHSYGLGIIVFTIAIRALLTPLNIRALRSQKKITALQPQLKALQQQFKGDRVALNQATMKLYSEEHAHPAGACLPMLVQLPILYAMFQIFRDLAAPVYASTTSTKPILDPTYFNNLHHPLFSRSSHTIDHKVVYTFQHIADPVYHYLYQHFLWFTLDKPDSLFGAVPAFFTGGSWGPLVIAAFVLQLVQARMMMQPTDDPQQRTTQQLTQIMPLIFSVIVIHYAAGLALYWVTTTLYTIILQYFTVGVGALLSSPFKIPYATNPAQRGSFAKTSPAVVKSSQPSRSTIIRDETVVDSAQHDPERKLGKMQRAATRNTSKNRTRSSKGARK